MLTLKKNGNSRAFLRSVLRRRHDEATNAWGTAPLGRVLRLQRESRQLSLPEVARVTGIPLKYLHLLEQGGDEQLGAEPLSLITHVQRYAEFLNLNPDITLGQFIAEFERVTPLEAASSSAPRTQLLKPLLPPRVRNVPQILLPLVALGLLLCVIAYSALKREQPANRDKGIALPPPSVSVPTPQSGAPPAASSPALSASPPAVGQPQSAPPPPAAAPPGAAVPPAEPPSSSPHRLRIQAKAKTWLHVTIDDQPMQRLFLLPGRSLEWSAEKGFTLSVGNAGAVKLSLDGQELPPLGKAGQMALNVRLPSRRGEQKQAARNAERPPAAQPR